MQVLFRRPDNTFVIEKNGFPYHVIPEDPLYDEFYEDAQSAPFEEIPVSIEVVPQVISDRQFFQQLAVDAFISPEDALAAVMTGTIPPAMESFVNNIQDPAQQFGARMILSGATEFRRNHPMVDAIGAYMGLDAAWIDGFFRRAAQL
jgi:hypothetical protein